MVRVVVNADDFGKNLVHNNDIDDAFKKGMITSVGTIVTGKYLQDALIHANSGGYMDRLHLHFNFAANVDSEDAPISEAMRKDSFFCEEGNFKKYRGLSGRWTDVRKWRVVYKEMVAQYNYFKKVTGGKADYHHVDFHLWYNLTWPVSLALNYFTVRYNIKTVRYWSIRQKEKGKRIIFRLLSWNTRVESVPACSIRYYLTKKQTLAKCKVVELFCHPNYKNGLLIDDTPSYLDKDRLPMQMLITELRNIEDLEFVSWKEVF